MDEETQWLSGGGELGALTRAKDWSGTSLGPLVKWSSTLRNLTSMMLASHAQIVLFWGPDFTVFYNDAYRAVLALKHPWALGRPGREVWPEIWDDKLSGLLEGVVSSGEAFSGSDVPFVLERQGYPEETYFDISYDPVREESGNVGGVRCIVSETTGRVVGERRLRMLRDLGTTLADAQNCEEVFRFGCDALAKSPRDISFAIAYVLDEDGGKCVYAVNIAPANRWPMEEMEEIDAGGSLLEGDDLARLGGVTGGEWSEPAKRAIALSFRAPGTGSTIALVLGLSPRLPFDDPYRDFVRLVGASFASALSHTAAREAERKRADVLAELDRAKTAFFSNVSHEFRTPLTLLLAPIEETLAESSSLSDNDRARMETAHRNAIRLLKLVNTLLDFSRIEAGRATASFEPVELCTLTTELASNFTSACENAGLDLVLKCDPLPRPVWIDRDMWEKIVLNLLSNAFKFTFEGSIEVCLRDDVAGAVLSVRDTGTGIAAKELPRIFERFHRVEGARARTHEGSGIGLSLVNDLVQLHGGHIDVVSTLGGGTCFTVRLRYGSEHLPPNQLRSRDPDANGIGVQPYVEEVLGWLSASAKTPTHGRPTLGVLCDARILVVDDNADMREHIVRLLKDYWFVEAATDGEAALALLREARFDVVVTDVMMPRLDGFGLLAAIRADPRLADMVVVMLSARAGEESRIEGHDAGADDYLVKPFSGRELVAQVRSHISRRRLRGATAKERDMVVAAERQARHEAELDRERLLGLVDELEVLRMKGEAANRTKDAASG
jgi:signal transduction histidine kinase/DNA-binding response OmpR family regulator